MKWIYRILGVFFVLILLIVGALFLIPTDRIAQIATDQFEAQTGRALTIGSDIRPTVWPKIGIQIEDITIANAPWSDQGPMVSAESVAVGVGLSALLGGKIEVDRFELVRPRILLETSADGEQNWDIYPTASDTLISSENTQDTANAVPEFSIAFGQITDGSITFMDHASGRVERLEDLNVVLRMPDISQSVIMDATGLYNAAFVDFDATLDTALDFIGGQTSGLDIAAVIGGTSLSLSGSISNAPFRFDGQINISSSERAQLFNALGQSVPELPQGFGKDIISLRSDVLFADQDQSLQLRNIILKLDDNQLTGDIGILQDERPKITANLQTDALDLSALGGRGEARRSDAGSNGWSTDTIDVSALGLLDADLKFSSGPINLGDVNLDTVNLTVALDTGRLVANFNPVSLYGGAISGDVVVNSRNGLSTRANIALSNLQLEPFLTAVADVDRLVGQADATVNVLAVGNSMDALMRSLEGDGNLSIGQGELLGLDIQGMILSLDMNYRGEGTKTIFNGITASYTLSNGVMRNNDLMLDAPLLTATGSGQVNIGEQNTNYRLVPTAFPSEGGSGITLPIVISGPWDNLKYQPELSALIGQDLSSLEDAARQNVREQLGDALGTNTPVTPETIRDTLEDAVTDTVRDTIQERLGGGLFGRD